MTRPSEGWVKARAECQARVFNELAECAETDLDDFNKLDDSPACAFVRRPGDDYFIVRLIDQLPELSRAVKFQLRDERIVAERFAPSATFPGQVDSSIDGRPVLQFASNRCLIEAEGELLEAWQFSRRVLEPVFFRSA